MYRSWRVPTSDRTYVEKNVFWEFWQLIRQKISVRATCQPLCMSAMWPVESYQQVQSWKTRRFVMAADETYVDITFLTQCEIWNLNVKLFQIYFLLIDK